jgi:hypothetical protein
VASIPDTSAAKHLLIVAEASRLAASSGRPAERVGIEQAITASLAMVATSVVRNGKTTGPVDPRSRSLALSTSN